MLEKQVLLDAAADSAEQIKKGNQKEFTVDSYLVDRLVKNIQKRSEDHNQKVLKRLDWHTMQPCKTSKNSNDDEKAQENEFEQTYVRTGLSKQKIDLQQFHDSVAETRTDRMLDAYESYSTVWAAQLRKSQKFRDSMDGIVNQN